MQREGLPSPALPRATQDPATAWGRTGLEGPMVIHYKHRQSTGINSAIMSPDKLPIS